ncbi:hypothetical protein MHW47_06125 [Streptomyces sp. OfavH-34-F]|uniref:hypothetical protein n=1 Tax=Streptomyces sp. OfavH-34-F TaxID=2917760 RepID=UPI001EF30260|nr:hypothetical protein [Streptomyces sp. OfavH-34-F]MCG7524019.1 hypothetical protein [Streptomyces sp. OfavH-34-F]
MSTTWQDRLAELIAGDHSYTGDPVDAGAQLRVVDEEGNEVFLQALARQHRVDEDDPQLIWIRPLVGGAESAGLGYVFNLSTARRRGLGWTEAHLEENGDVVLRLQSGETAVVQPAGGERLVELQRWDRFTDRLTREEEVQLDALDSDSWHGQFS